MNRGYEAIGADKQGGPGRGGLEDLVSSPDFRRDQKLEILRRLELDLREGMVAEEENMTAPEPSAVALDQVLDALRSLGAES